MAPESVSVREFPTVPEALYACLGAFSGTTIFHRPEWHRVLEEAFGWTTRCLAGVDGEGRFLWFLPFVRKRRLGRRINVCLPLSHRVGVAWRGPQPPKITLPESFDAPLEVHERLRSAPVREGYRHLETVLDLAAHESFEGWYKSIGDPRRRVRRALEAGFVARCTLEAADFAAFSALQAETRRRQGVPTYPDAFFPAIQRHMAQAGLARLFLVERQGDPVAGVLFFEHGGKAIDGYNASVADREMWRMGVNQLAMYAAIRDCYERGVRELSFGSTPSHQTNLRLYKERWGGRSEPLIHSHTCDAAVSVDQGGPAVALAGAIIRQMPLPMFRRVSPALLRCVV